MVFDPELLAKVLGMTDSAHDGEKLAALSRANALLKAAGLTWADVIGLKTTQREPLYSYRPQNQYAYDSPRNRGPYSQYGPEMDQQRWGRDFYADIELQARAEQQRQRGEQQRAERERKQAERDQYKEWRADPVVDDIWAEETVRRDGRAELAIRMREAGFDDKSLANYLLFASNQPEIAEWLWQHRDDDTITKLSFKAAITFPLRLGPLHINILSTMMRKRA